MNTMLMNSPYVEDNYALLDTFYDSTGTQCELKLYPSTLQIRVSGRPAGRSLEEVSTDDIVGLTTTIPTDDANKCDNIEFVFHVCSKKSESLCCGSDVTPARCIRKLAFQLRADNPADLQTIATQWRDCLPLARREPTKKLLVVVNPYSGRKKAGDVFRTVVEPFFKNCNIAYDVILTNSKGHAEEIAKSAPLNEYCGIVVVSGDGLLFEVINGLMKREDWFTALDTPLGIIPGGTSNALVGAIACESGESCLRKKALNATYIVSRNVHRPMDLMFVETETWSSFAFLLTSWGIICDLSVATDEIRWMGPIRVDVTAVRKIISKRVRGGKLEYLPIDAVLDNRPEEYNTNPFKRRILPHMNQPVPSNWHTIEGDFITIDAMLCSHISTKFRIVPTSKLDDGVINLMVIKGSQSRMQLLKSFMRMENADFDASREPGIEIIKTRAFRITPSEPEHTFAVDGEIMVSPTPVSCIQCEVRPSAVQIMSNPCE